MPSAACVSPTAWCASASVASAFEIPERVPPSPSRASPRPTSSRPARSHARTLGARGDQGRRLPQREAQLAGKRRVELSLLQGEIALAAQLADQAEEEWRAIARLSIDPRRSASATVAWTRRARRPAGRATTAPTAHRPGEDALVVPDAEGDDVEVAGPVVRERRGEVLERHPAVAPVEERHPHGPVAAQSRQAGSALVGDRQLAAGERDRRVEVRVGRLLHGQAVEAAVSSSASPTRSPSSIARFQTGRSVAAPTPSDPIIALASRIPSHISRQSRSGSARGPPAARFRAVVGCSLGQRGRPGGAASRQLEELRRAQRLAAVREVVAGSSGSPATYSGNCSSITEATSRWS